jgi:hypothetical protein
MTNYIILLPPSEGKAKEGNENKPYRLVENSKQHNYFKKLNFDRQYLINSLKEAISISETKELEKIFELKDKKLQEAIENILDILNLPTLPAIERYTGVMFKAMNYQNLSDIEKERANQSILFISGLFGLLKPQDYIPEYKLKISSKIKDLSITQFWKERLRGILELEIKDKLILDLLPQTHQKVLEYNSLDTIKIQFAKKENGKLKQEGHFSKELKGEFIKYILKKEKITKEYIKAFTHSKGHTFDAEKSSENTYIFSK